MRSSFIRVVLLKGANFTKLKRRTRQALATLIGAAVLNLIALPGYAKPKAGSNLTPAAIIGTLAVQGAVKVNGSPAASGQTLFSGCGIITSAESESTLDLQNQARLKLERETSLRIESSKADLSAALDLGVMRALIPTSVRAGISTPDALITSDPNQAAAFSVLVDECNTTLIVQTGRVEILSGDRVKAISAGESYSTGGGPQAPGGHSLTGRKKAGLAIGIGGAVAILLLVLRGEKPADEGSFGGCVIILSPTSGGGGC